MFSQFRLLQIQKEGIRYQMIQQEQTPASKGTVATEVSIISDIRSLLLIIALLVFSQLQILIQSLSIILKTKLMTEQTSQYKLKNKTSMESSDILLVQQRKTSNEVLVEEKGNKITYFLLAYLRVVFKKITELDIEHNSGEMSATVVFTIRYKGLEDRIKKRIREGVNITVNNEMFCDLDPNPVKHRNIEDGRISVTEDIQLEEWSFGAVFILLNYLQKVSRTNSFIIIKILTRMSKDKKKTKQDKPGKQMKQDKEEDKRQFSNNVLVLTEGDKKTLFLPAYLRLAFKKITQLDVHEGSGEMSATVILTIYYKGLSPEIVEHIKKNLDVAINNEMFYNLDPDPNRQRNLEDGKVSASDNEKKSEYTVQWRNKFPLEMDCDIFLTPFEVLELSISFALRTITWNEGDVKVSVKMNFMDCPEKDFIEKFSLQESDDFGEYGLAESSLQAKYVSTLKEEPPQEPEKKNVSIQEPSSSTELIPKQKEKKKKKTIKNWQYACFSLKMYRYPFNTVLTIFLPILLLAVITLAIFFQDFGFGGRIASIATLMVAYSAFLPTVRESLPPVPTCMMFDVIVYSMIFTSILCLIRSWIDREMDTTENPYDWTTDPLFLISLALVCLWTFLLIVTLIVHKCIWELQYNRIRAKAHEKGDFDSSKWVTKECNEYFESLKEKCVDIKQLLLIQQVPIKGPRRLEPIQRTIQRSFLEGDNIIGSASIANSRLLI